MLPRIIKQACEVWTLDRIVKMEVMNVTAVSIE